jgi:hypothetical protein
MKGLLIHKPILGAVVDHIHLYDFGHFLLMLKMKGYEKFVEGLKKNFKKVKSMPVFIQMVKYQPHGTCIQAVRRKGLLLEFIRQQTEEICLAAVRQDGSSLKYVDYQTEEMCKEAIWQNKGFGGYIRSNKILCKLQNIDRSRKYLGYRIE